MRRRDLPHHPSNRETAMPGLPRRLLASDPSGSPDPSRVSSGPGRQSSVTVARLRRTCTVLPFRGKLFVVDNITPCEKISSRETLPDPQQRTENRVRDLGISLALTRRMNGVGTGIIVLGVKTERQRHQCDIAQPGKPGQRGAVLPEPSFTASSDRLSATFFMLSSNTSSFNG